MPAILFRVRETFGNIAARFYALIGRRNILDVPLDGDAIETTDEVNSTGKERDKKEVFRLDCSKVVLSLEAVESGLDENGLGRILNAHTSPSTVQRIVIVHHTMVTALPVSLGKFTNIWSLDLSNNSLTSLPWSIVYLRNLRVLNLSRNKFTTIPSFVWQLTTLEALNVSVNDLRYLPTGLVHLQLLKVLDLHGNANLKSPSQDVCAQGKDAIFKALNSRSGRRNLWMNSQRRYVEQGQHLSDDVHFKTLLELCVGTILQFNLDYFMEAVVPPPLKRYVHEKDVERMEALKIAKCSRCLGFFSSQFTFETHDCPRQLS